MANFPANDSLVGEINKRLPSEQQIQANDPMYAGIVINKIAVETYADLIQRKLAEAFSEINASAEQQVTRAETVANRLISQSADNIERQLDAAATRWEERLRHTASEADTNIRRTCRITWICAIVIGLYACGMVGNYFGNAVFNLMHPLKQVHRAEQNIPCKGSKPMQRHK